MHELSIAMSILEIVEEEAKAHAPARIAAVHVKVGPLSGVLPDALVSAFELACEGTEFGGCKMVIRETPLVIRCPNCDADRPAESVQMLCCSVCGTPAAEVVSGKELEVCAMELEE